MWVNAKDAKIGINYNTMRQQIKRCSAKFQYRYVAGRGKGGKSLEVWEESLENKNSKPLKSTEQTNNASKYLKLTKTEQKRVLDRVALIKSYLERGDVTFEEWKKDFDIPFTKQHFMRLVKKYKSSKQNILENFLDNRGRPKGSLKMTKEMCDMAERYLLRSDIFPNNFGIYTLMKHAFKNDLPSRDTVIRYLNRFRCENRMLMAYVSNPDKARGKYRAAFGNASKKAKYKNHYWELDGTKADIFTADGKRPTIVAAIDIYTRRAVLSVEERSNSYALSRNLREAILKLGVPENIITDNGRDYLSNHFESICQNLGINKREVPPYSGWEKPHIERFFGTMTRELFRQLEGFCGHNVSEHSAIQSTLTFEEQLEAKKIWREKRYAEHNFTRSMMQEKMPLFIPLSIEELRQWLNAWIECVYEQRTHGSLGVSPAEKYNSDITAVKTIENERCLDILLGEWLMMNVGKKGIVIRRDGIDAIYQHNALIYYIGEKVYVALGTDAGEAFIYDEQMAFICKASDNSLIGRSREEMKLLHKQINRLERESIKAKQKAQQLAEKLSDPTMKDVIAERAKNIKLPSSIKTALQVDIEMPNDSLQTIETLNGRPIFESDYEALVWAIENECDSEYEELIGSRANLYEMAKAEVAYKKAKMAT